LCTVTKCEETTTCTVNADGDQTCNNDNNNNNNADGDGDDSQQQQKQMCLPNGICYDSLDDMVKAYPYPDEQKFVNIELTSPMEFGDPQQIAGPNKKEMLQLLSETYDYMLKDVFQNETAKSYRNDCKLRNELCTFWSSIGECEKNPAYSKLMPLPLLLMFNDDVQCAYCYEEIRRCKVC
jgi:hypothetical protein